MCRYIMTFAEYSCGHQYPLRRQRVDCNRSWCALSTSHNEEEHNHRQCATELNPDLNLVMPGFCYPHPCNLCLGRPPTRGNGRSGVRMGPNGWASDSESSDESGGSPEEVTVNGA
ncbi:hypothetical protein CERSUDRAFT_113912 [Gelatoporia subvermispora B]|uniref:Uncharacterized protein n=1 Tax=Ceriporiopsis subvermispora (strain B) TaxID=914234 RepID=M2REJ5_CERS8|nr:hypothetical protein CERSUDRAFT_113912 [Gelatoporia subvermispora B]